MPGAIERHDMTDMTGPSPSEAVSDFDAPDHGNKREQRRPLTAEEQLDLGVEDSMDASDPPASVAPGDDGEPHPSSGYDEAKEKGR